MNIFKRITERPKAKPKQQAIVDIHEDTEPPVHRPHGKSKAGWVSPTYTDSTAVILDPVRVAESRCITLLPNAKEIEFYRMLRTRMLRRMKGEGGSTIMVTSAQPGEGKTLTAINLAFSFGRDYHRTALLVDCDLRKQSIHHYLGTPGEHGLIEYLLGDAELSDLIIWPGVEKVTLISGGGSYAESTELLGSPRMRELVAEMKARYPERYVFFDLPPVLSCADAAVFAPLVDWIVVVVRSGFTSIADVNAALEHLPAEKIIGLVLNGQEDLQWKYGNKYRKKYGYGYGYGYPY